MMRKNKIVFKDYPTVWERIWNFYERIFPIIYGVHMLVVLLLTIYIQVRGLQKHNDISGLIFLILCIISFAWKDLYSKNKARDYLPILMITIIYVAFSWDNIKMVYHW